MDNKNLSPIKQLFTQSWALLRSMIAPLILFNIVVIAVLIAAILMMVVGFLLLGLGAGFSGLLDSNPLNVGMGVLASFALLYIVIVVITSISQIGEIIILHEANPKTNIFSVIKRTAKYIIPIMILGVVTSFFTFGGFFVFIIPAIAFSILFSLSYYVMITENAGPLRALRRSVFLIINNFSGFFLRMLALWGVFILFFIVFSMFNGILSSILDDDFGAIITSIINFVFQFGISWYAFAYTLTLFKQLQKISPTGESSLKIILVISVIGWVLSFIIGYFIIKAIPSFLEQIENYNNLLDKGIDEDLSSEEIDQILKEIDGELNMEDIDKYMEESTESSEINTSTTPPAETI